MPTGPRKTETPKAAVERQLANLVTYPDVPRLTQQAGVVVIQFLVNTDSELCELAVFSQNEQIDASLTKQLPGRKVVGYGSDAAELHTVRLRFWPE